MAHLSYSSESGIGTIALNSPPANSYGIDFIRELDAAIYAAEKDANCRVVVVRSAVPGFFCGGADIKLFAENAPRDNIDMITFAHEALSRMAKSEKMYIAEIAGHALGGGLEIALACDLRFAAAGKYRLGLPEVSLGLLPGNGGTQRLTALVGVGKALELMTLGVRLLPEEALALGLVNRVFGEAELRAKTMAIATDLSNSATLAVGKIKRSVYDGYYSSMAAGLAVERHNIAILFETADAREGFAAFAQRRKPKFSGK